MFWIIYPARWGGGVCEFFPDVFYYSVTVNFRITYSGCHVLEWYVNKRCKVMIL